MPAATARNAYSASGVDTPACAATRDASPWMGMTMIVLAASNAPRTRAPNARNAVTVHLSEGHVLSNTQAQHFVRLLRTRTPRCDRDRVRDLTLVNVACDTHGFMKHAHRVLVLTLLAGACGNSSSETTKGADKSKPAASSKPAPTQAPPPAPAKPEPPAVSGEQLLADTLAYAKKLVRFGN